MSLITCPECNKQISDEAQFCPHCGYPIKSYIKMGETTINKLLRPKDVKNLLGCSMTTTYAIINQKDFPKIMIGKRAYINPKAFDEWIKKYTYKTYVL